MTAALAHFDVLIVGAGQAAIPLGEALAKAGKLVGIAERKHLGGSCVNFGCIPTKAAVASAGMAHLGRRSMDFGISVQEVKPDFAAVMERAKGFANDARKGLELRLGECENPRLLTGHARFAGRSGSGFALSVGEQGVTAEQVVLDTGTRSAVPKDAGFNALPYLHSGNWLDCRKLPERLLILGAGYIGLEMAQFYLRMGSQVTVLDGSAQVVSQEDEDVARALEGMLEREGARFVLNRRLKRVEKLPGGGVEAWLEGGESLKASDIFVAVGRKPNTDDLGLETVGVETAGDGIIKVDERLSSSVQGVWVAGDIRGGPQFTSTSWDDHRVLVSQLMGDGSRTTKRMVPYAVFTDPELGRVGLTEKEAQAQGKRARVVRYEMEHNGRARVMGRPEGFIKLIGEAESGRLLGAAVLAAEAAELIHVYATMMHAGMSLDSLQDGLAVHPTLAEAIHSAARTF